ncbi:hypothetical protein HJC23_004381 [Cyclotella cryptica]|uniref:Letm1 RBD domain-containing protein n=1 Tax=Cyclotella cryptica TaxID=29204 RepID=A0ABD3PJ56_9STRA|eukprot:CCRYP_014570-RA/>CCRYP_014570-RA protein AED:0.03 eAED:0.03 QI:341/1/1/1/0.75/0.55/9/8523/694
MAPRMSAFPWLAAGVCLHAMVSPNACWQTSPLFCASAFTTPAARSASRASPTKTPHRSKLPSQSRHRDCLARRSATLPETPPAIELPSPLAPSPLPVAADSKLRRLKDRMWIRETLEDLTAAEFASSLSVEDAEKTASTNRKRDVDFENVLAKLDARVEGMCVLMTEEESIRGNQTCYVLERRVVGDEGKTTVLNSCFALAENVGMGSVVCTAEQREALLSRIMATRAKLIDFMEGSTTTTATSSSSNRSDGGNDMGDIDEIRTRLQPTNYSTVNDNANGAVKGFDPSLYVREDGTIDWDGALQDREALKKFGSAVWSRINGQDPELSGEMDNNDEGGSVVQGDDFHSHGRKAVTAKIVETEAIRQKKEYLDQLTSALRIMEAEHTKLLNSAISAGQAVANVNFATINPTLRMKIRTSSDELEKKRGEVTFHTLNYELERIFTYLDGELGNTATKGYIPLQDRLNVAEFGLLESQIESFNRQMMLGESLDEDVLAVVSDQLVDFKRRLGIDYILNDGLTFDSEALQIWLKDIWIKTKKGFVFYVKGTRLFLDDIVFCLNLIGRALQGYTLKPREVRTLRRTFKDTITFIPVVIILLIPLSPIGHVLVFGAIQRVFPDFFPSCFTERRQNLLELYESTEYSGVTINETWQEKLARLFQALGFFASQLGNRLYASISGIDDLSNEDNDDDDSIRRT